jgi:hypothetical protein
MFEEPGFLGAVGDLEPILRTLPMTMRTIWLDRGAGVGLWVTGPQSHLTSGIYVSTQLQSRSF